ncbi:MAG TPA: TauD/TfdA family dioxygenase [Haliangium sp.]|nr:TauD/TfdA family dioxygenase [Haliangium sp.]
MPIIGPSAWKGCDLTGDPSWSHHLAADELRALDHAITAARKTGLPWTKLTREHFALRELGHEIRHWMQKLNHGRGFVLVKGFPVDDYSKEDAAIAYWAIGRLMGDPVPQNKEGELLGHVRDTGELATNPRTRLYKTSKRQEFHTDGADIVGLFCLRRAKAGGLSQIVSSASVFNEILRRRPDLTPRLFEPFYWDLAGEHPPGAKPYMTLPICQLVNGRLRTFYIGWYIRNAQQYPEVPRLTQEQDEVLQLIEEIANDPEFRLDMDFEPGDMQFLKNSTILHSRTAYEDFDEPDRQRHLLRLWLTAREFTDGDELLRQGFRGDTR